MALSDLADWWDQQKRESEAILTEWVQDNPQWWAVAVAGTVQTSMDLGAGFVDVLRFGQGMAEGGIKGVGKDALRLLMLLGPLGRAGGAASRFLTPLMQSGRLRLALLDLEPGFWGNGSYFGDKDLLSIGIGGQFQKHGSSDMTTDKSWGEFNTDVLFEKKIPGGGWFTVEGAYYHFNVLDGGISDSLYGLLAYASPTVGVGNIQPMVRYQWEKVKAGMGTNPWNLDVGLSYLIKGPALRIVANYGHTKIADSLSANSLQIGAQAIFF